MNRGLYYGWLDYGPIKQLSIQSVLVLESGRGASESGSSRAVIFFFSNLILEMRRDLSPTLKTGSNGSSFSNDLHTCATISFGSVPVNASQSVKALLAVDFVSVVMPAAPSDTLSTWIFNWPNEFIAGVILMVRIGLAKRVRAVAISII